MRRNDKIEPLKVTEQLLEQHRAGTQRERAQIEYELWYRAPRSERKRITDKYRSQHWVADQLGVASNNEVAMRMLLHPHGDAIGALWARVEGDMPLGTAYRLLRDAQKARHVREPLELAVQRVLDDYDQRGVVRSGQDGKVYRVHKRSSLNGREDRKSSDTFWDKMRDLIATYLDERLTGLDEAVVARERERFESELKVLFDSATSRFRRLRSESNTGLSITVARRALREACDVLRLDPPTVVNPAFMKQARQRFRSLAKEYHPDRRGEVTRAEYDAVLAAWHSIEHYQEHYGKEQ